MDNNLICSAWVVLCGALQEYAKLPMFDQNLGKNLERKKVHCKPCTNTPGSAAPITASQCLLNREESGSGRVAPFKVSIDLETMANQNLTGFSREPVAMSLQPVDDLSEPDTK